MSPSQRDDRVGVARLDPFRERSGLDMQVAAMSRKVERTPHRGPPFQKLEQSRMQSIAPGGGETVQ